MIIRPEDPDSQVKHDDDPQLDGERAKALEKKSPKTKEPTNENTHKKDGSLNILSINWDGVFKVPEDRDFNSSRRIRSHNSSKRTHDGSSTGTSSSSSPGQNKRQRSGSAIERPGYSTRDSDKSTLEWNDHVQIPVSSSGLPVGRAKISGHPQDGNPRKRALVTEGIDEEPPNKQQKTEEQASVPTDLYLSIASRLDPRSSSDHHFPTNVSKKGQKATNNLSDPSGKQSYVEKNSYGSEISMRKTENTILTESDLGHNQDVINDSSTPFKFKRVNLPFASLESTLHPLILSYMFGYGAAGDLQTPEFAVEEHDSD